ncbi:MAG: flagellar biosynthetic protein FliO [Pseudomonadota bacterium]
MNEIAFFPSLLKMLFALAIVIGLIVATMYVLRKYLNPPPVSRDGSLIQIVSTRYIGPKCSIMLVEVLGNVIVLGLANGQMTVLTTIVDDQALEIMKTVRENESLQPVLVDRLKRYTDKFKTLAREQKGRQKR